MKTGLLKHFIFPVSMLITYDGSSFAACAPSDFQCEINATNSVLDSALSDITALKTANTLLPGMLNGKVDKLSGQWLKACQIPAGGTTFIVPQGWTTRDCANYMVQVGAGNMYFQCVQFAYAATVSFGAPAPISNILPQPQVITIQGPVPDLRGTYAQAHELPAPNNCQWVIP